MTNTPTQAAIEAAARAIDDTYDVDCGGDMLNLREVATAAIEAYRAAMREAGVVEVPVVPTDNMEAAGWTPYYAEEGVPEVWAAMIAARPQIGGE